MSKRLRVEQDFLLSKASGTLYAGGKQIEAVILEDGIKLSPGGTEGIFEITVTFFARSYAEIDDYEKILLEQELAHERARRLFEGSKQRDTQNAAFKEEVDKQTEDEELRMAKARNEGIQKSFKNSVVGKKDQK